MTGQVFSFPKEEDIGDIFHSQRPEDNLLIQCIIFTVDSINNKYFYTFEELK